VSRVESRASRVLITGASTGIGRAHALRWAKDGAQLALNAPEASQLEEVGREVKALGAPAPLLVPGDVTKEPDRQRLVERTRTELEGIDVLVNNAGRGYYGLVRNTDVRDLEGLFALNVFAPLRLVQIALDDLIASKGTIVMMSSIAGVAAAPGMSVYAASKFALEAIAISLRAELADDGVRVLVVRPGPVDTPFRENATAKQVEAGVRTRGADVQTAETVAERTFSAVKSGAAVLETSLYVRVASFGARVVPPVFRAITRRMAAKEKLKT
jgi:short-subunit dehydrogenase